MAKTVITERGIQVVLHESPLLLIWSTHTVLQIKILGADCGFFSTAHTRTSVRPEFADLARIAIHFTRKE